MIKLFCLNFGVVVCLFYTCLMPPPQFRHEPEAVRSHLCAAITTAKRQKI